MGAGALYTWAPVHSIHGRRCTLYMGAVLVLVLLVLVVVPYL